VHGDVLLNHPHVAREKRCRQPGCSDNPECRAYLNLNEHDSSPRNFSMAHISKNRASKMMRLVIAVDVVEQDLQQPLWELGLRCF
jgi:hypothetical protein